MIRNIRGGGSSSSSSGPSITDIDPSFDRDSTPFGGSGGKTGSETIAEGGSPASTVTNDPSHSSVSDKYDNARNAVSDMIDRASDGNDGSTTTFDATPDNDEGKQAIQDSVESIVEATNESTDQQDQHLPPAVNPLPDQVPTPDLPNLSGGRAKAFVAAAVTVLLVIVWGG